MVFLCVTIFRKDNENKKDDNNNEPIHTNYKTHPSDKIDQYDTIKNQNLKSQKISMLELEDEKAHLKKTNEKNMFIKRICIYSIFLAFLVIASVSNKDPNSFNYQMITERNFAPVAAQV